METTLTKGIWATMITPFTKDAQVDYDALERLMYFYREGGANGVFALCQSSEIVKMTLEERLRVMRFVAEKLPKGLGMVASGHVADELPEQIEQLKAVRGAGANTLVLVTNRLAAADEGEDAFLARTEKILEAIPDADFGLYECPLPYKRIVPAETMKRLAETGRFTFMKETSCSIAALEGKMDAVRGTRLGVYNANAATLLASLRMGAAGYCGIMCNFHPDLYARLYRAFTEGKDALAERLSDAIGVLSVYERQWYPVNAKWYLGDDVGMTSVSRVQNAEGLTESMKIELEEMKRHTDWIRETVGR